jgi:hypothetical protein
MRYIMLGERWQVLIGCLGHGTAFAGHGVDFGSARMETLESDCSGEREYTGSTDTQVVVQNEQLAYKWVRKQG